MGKTHLYTIGANGTFQELPAVPVDYQSAIDSSKSFVEEVLVETILGKSLTLIDNKNMSLIGIDGDKIEGTYTTKNNVLTMNSPQLNLIFEENSQNKNA